MQFEKNEHFFQTPLITPAQRVQFCTEARKNLLMLIYSKLHSKSCDYVYKLHLVHICAISTSQAPKKLRDKGNHKQNNGKSFSIFLCLCVFFRTAHALLIARTRKNCGNTAFAYIALRLCSNIFENRLTS